VEYFLQPIETRTGPQEASISLTRSIPWLGRLSLDKQLKQNDTDMVKALVTATHLEVIRKLRHELDVALEAFQGGQYSILELIDSEKSWLDFELARIKAQADKTIQIARLEELTGTTLVDWDQNT
jgi:hypothetical protein